MSHAHLGTLARNDLRERREKTAQDAYVLVVDVVNIVVAEVALLLFLNGWVCVIHTG